ncbi:hypothetical protein B7P43_G08446 [Cryptotermes secundus]|nr:hypothetical protein B7P43_G08446 [Cryptotermes secundus]PNF21770.1 hypothetical protein B7P43_G08446 [Cryptotermes secundus]
MQRTDIQKRIAALVRESKNLNTSIRQLKEKLSVRHNLPLQQAGSDDFDSRASHSVSKRTENPKLLMKKLKISEWINKVVYTNDEIKLLDDGSSQYIADAVTGPVTFQVQFVVEDIKNKEMILHSLKIRYIDPFHEAELKTFSNRCMRQNSFQKLIRGVVSYGELFANREETTDWLTEKNGHFTVNKHHEDGAYNITAKAEGRTVSYFTCEWKIIWNEGSLAMIPSFTIRANNKSNFYKENEYHFDKIVSSGITQDEIIELWKELAKAVIIENELASHVIQKNVP